MTQKEIQKIEQEIEQYEKQLYRAAREDDAKGGTEMGKNLIESYRKGIQKLRDKLRDS